jgi:uncharacterized membrane protein
VNPFDPRSALLAKHAQHVVLIHFPIALCIIGVAFDFVALRTKNAAMAAAAYYNLVVAATATVPVLLTGILAWRFALEGAALKGILLYHLLSGITVSLLIWIAARWHYRAQRKGAPLPGYRWAVQIVALLLMGMTAHLGGFLSGANS